MRIFLLMSLPFLLILTLSGCNSEISASTAESFTLSSPVMADGGELLANYTCDGDGISPPLSWSGAPQATTAYALIMHHVAGPDDVHWYWVMYAIDKDIGLLDAGEIQGMMGSNSVNDLNEYAPPCSKGAGIKSYTITLYALSGSPELSNALTVDRETLLTAIEGITLDSAELTVNYERHSSDTLSRCETIQQTVNLAGFSSSVAVTCDDNYAYVTSDTYPDHDLMNGIIGTNEQIPVPALNYTAPIKLNPTFASSLTSIDASVGVAVNGVPIYDYSSQGDLDIYNYDPNSDTVLLDQLDNCGGHAGRGDDYHYHASPNCMIDSMQNFGDDTIIGWGYDGYPLYGVNNPDGSSISEGVLDVCNGQLDDTFGYRYHTSIQPPYIIQCLVGEVDTSILPRVNPLSGDTAGIRTDLTPPAEGVENLIHSIAGDGTRTMSYSYNGDDYYVTYKPSTSQSNCYDFEQKTVTHGGIVESGTFCRDTQAPSTLNKVTAVLDYSQIQTYGSALADQVDLGDGGGIDNVFRNSGVIVDETANAYFAVNGVHPINQGQYDLYYPKSIVKASLADDTILQSYSFSQVNDHDVDMEALSFAEGKNYLYIGDENNFIYEMDLSNGEITREWDMADIGISTSVDKGIEAMTYSTANGYFYVGIQELEKVVSVALSLTSGETLTQVSEFNLPAGSSPSGLFAHSDGSLYTVAISQSDTQMIYRYTADGNLQCEIEIPSALGIVRPDGIFIDSMDDFLYITDSQGPLYGGSSLYRIGWTDPCN